jgi:hypothetical protein
MRTRLSPAKPAIGSVFKMSQQSNFRNRPVVKNSECQLLSESSRVTPRDTQVPASSPGLAAGAFPCWPLLAALQMSKNIRYFSKRRRLPSSAPSSDTAISERWPVSSACLTIYTLANDLDRQFGDVPVG